eukprot:5485137-Karenia_brevis.AAC.1
MSNVTTVVDQMIARGMSVVVADTVSTDRWQQRDLEPFKCRGDVALYGNDMAVIDSLRQWTHSKDNGAPRSVDDLEEVEFADTLRFITQDAHLDSL